MMKNSAIKIYMKFKFNKLMKNIKESQINKKDLMNRKYNH